MQNNLSLPGLSLVALLISGVASAQPYPTKTIRFVLPFSPGGGTDAVARTLGQKMTEQFGQQVVIDNRGGVGGIVGVQMAVQAEPDGHTIMLGIPAVITVSPAVFKNLPFDPINDLSPVGFAGTSAYVLALHPSLPVSSVKALIALAKQKPGQLTYAGNSGGAGNQLAGELFKSMTGINMLHIPYKGGGPSLIAVLAGEANMIFGSQLTVLPHIRTKRIRALAVTSARRTAALSDLPTIAEAGVPGYEIDVWYGVFVPKKTPQRIVEMLNQNIVKTMNDATVIASLSAQGMEARSSTPTELAQRIQSETVKWAKLVKEAGIKGE